MKNNNIDKSRGRMIMLLGVLLAALWLVIVHATIEDAREESMSARVRPGVVQNGTRNAAPMPVYMAQRRQGGAPMISGGAVRSYARSGHATMPIAASGTGYQLHTTSSATIHSIGSGGGGMAMAGTSSASSSTSRGIVYGTTNVSMPSFALATPLYTTVKAEQTQQVALAAAPGRNGRVRKLAPDWDGDEGDTEEDSDESGKWWYWDPDGEEWVTDENMSGSYIGLTRNTGSGIEVWNGSSWVTMEEWQNPGVPVGATPWLLMLLLVGAYSIVKTMHKKQNAI